MSFGNVFRAKPCVALFITFENCKKQCEESHYSMPNSCENHEGIQLNKISNRTPVIEHPRDRAPVA